MSKKIHIVARYSAFVRPAPDEMKYALLTGTRTQCEAAITRSRAAATGDGPNMPEPTYWIEPTVYEIDIGAD